MKHETQIDRIAEDAISNIWMADMKNRGRDLVQHKIPDGPRYCFDFAYAFKCKPLDIISIAEVKDRPSWKKSYGTVMLGASKVKQLVEYNENGLPSYFIARLEGHVCYYRMAKRTLRFDLRWGGRSDRDDDRDKEPCYMIPLAYFYKCFQ